MFRRPMRPMRPFRRAMMQPNQIVLQAIERANQLMANGKPNDAAQIFERLAQEAEQRGLQKPAANAHAQAAHAYTLAKNEKAAITQARAALTKFLQLGMAQRATNFFNNAIQTAHANGWTTSADALQKEFGDQVKALGAQNAIAPQGRLPSKCPHCAAPARSDEVDWIDATSAECNFCGGVIQTE